MKRKRIETNETYVIKQEQWVRRNHICSMPTPELYYFIITLPVFFVTGGIHR